MNLKENAKKLKESLPIIYYVLKDKKTPVYSKILAGITIGYALSPIDLIPDFIPVLGYLDDLIVLPVLVYFTLKTIPQSTIEEAKIKADLYWKTNKSKKWVYAIPIICLWSILLIWILKIVL